MRIERLHERHDLVATLAALLHREWGHLPAWASQAEIAARLLRESRETASVPFTLLALSEDGELLGTASVRRFELPEHVDKMYWLGEVLVRVEQRGRGTGSALIQACINEGQRLSLPSLYLYTPDQQALYARAGWVEMERTVANGELVSIMWRALTPR